MEHASPSVSAVSAAHFLMTRPISATASMLMPARVEPTFTLAQTRSVRASASGMEAMRLRSPVVKPFCTRAEKPPMKFTPTSRAARSIASAMGTRSSPHPPAMSATGVTDTRLFTMGMPNSRSMASPTGTRSCASRQIFS